MQCQVKQTDKWYVDLGGIGPRLRIYRTRWQTIATRPTYGILSQIIEARDRLWISGIS